MNRDSIVDMPPTEMKSEQSPHFVENNSTSFETLNIYSIFKASGEKLYTRFLSCGEEDTLIHKTIPSATELKVAGVKFKAKDSSKVLINVTFNDGTMEIPKIYIFRRAPALLRNLVAVEQCSMGSVGKKVSTYVMFMSCLLSTPEDVVALKRKEVIRHSLGDDATVARHFHQIGNKVCMRSLDLYLLKVINDVNKYNTRNKWWAKLRRDYFGSPWSVISFVAASMLLLLTMGKTGMDLYEFVQHHK